jgi:uncharacterized protein YceK
MKKLVLALLTVALLSIIQGCGDSSSSGSSNTGNGTTYYAMALDANGQTYGTKMGPYSTITACQEFIATQNSINSPFHNSRCVAQ